MHSYGTRILSIILSKNYCISGTLMLYYNRREKQTNAEPHGTSGRKVHTMKNSRFHVIGGQYEFCYYGSAETLTDAKRLAAKHDEFWDNWQGFHRPKIYAAKDCWEVRGCFYPRHDKRVFPVSEYDMLAQKWNDAER